MPKPENRNVVSRYARKNCKRSFTVVSQLNGHNVMTYKTIESAFKRMKKIARDWKNKDEKTILHIVKITRTVDWYGNENFLIELSEDLFGEDITPCYQRVYYDPWYQELVLEYHKETYPFK